MKSLRRKYMGAEWLFVDDVDFPKTGREDDEILQALDDKFKKICIEKQLSSSKPERLYSLENLKGGSSAGSLNNKTTKYRSPWYINPKYWQQLSKVPEVNKKDIENRAKNLYYFLHKGEPNLNPLAKRDKKVNRYEQMYADSQKKLSTLPTVHNYKKYLEGKKLRLPACLQSLPDNIGVN